MEPSSSYPSYCSLSLLDHFAALRGSREGWRLLNADGSRGRKLATFAACTATAVLPAGTLFTAASVACASSSAVTLGVGQNAVPLRALDAGSARNLAAGATLAIVSAVVGVSGAAGTTAASMTGGADVESDDKYRVRSLDRIR